MNNNVIKGLLGLCLLLFLILLVEWQLTGTTGQTVVKSTAEQQEQLTELPRLELAKQTEEAYSQMVERPLFIQGRRLVISDVDEVAADEDVGKIDDLTLLGIYSIKDVTSALFSKKGKDKKFLKKSEGEDVAGWLLKEIKADRVVLEQHGNKQTLMLRKPKPKTLKKTRRPRLTPRKKIKLKSRETK